MTKFFVPPLALRGRFRPRGLFFQDGLVKKMKSKPPFSFYAVPILFLFFFYSENSASNALGFLKNVKTAADRIAFAVEQAERTNVDHDTMTVYLYGDDYRDIQNYLASTKPKGALVKGPLPGVKLNAITMQSIGPAPTINETPMGLCMIFTNESGNMLPQKVLVRLRNGPLNSTKPMNVRLERGNSMRPVVPFVPVGNLQTAAGSPLGGPQIDKSKNTLSPAENTPTKNDFPKVAGAAAQNSVLPSPAPVPQIDIKSLFSGIPGFSSLNGSQTPASAGFASRFSPPSSDGSGGAKDFTASLQSAVQQSTPSTNSSQLPTVTDQPPHMHPFFLPPVSK